MRPPSIWVEFYSASAPWGVKRSAPTLSPRTVSRIQGKHYAISSVYQLHGRAIATSGNSDATPDVWTNTSDCLN